MQHEEQQQIRDALAGNPVCYILITCGSPGADGHMQVEMTYKGDATVASYLLQQAQAVVDEEVDGVLEELEPSHAKVVEIG